MRALITSISLVSISLGADAQNPVQQVVKGFVFHDITENRIKEASEKGKPCRPSDEYPSSQGNSSQ